MNHIIGKKASNILETATFVKIRIDDEEADLDLRLTRIEGLRLLNALYDQGVFKHDN